jgi:hypothetical protein
MEEKQNRNIEEAPERVKNRLPLEKLRLVLNYKDLSAKVFI